jgi:hypothetical protein
MNAIKRTTEMHDNTFTLTEFKARLENKNIKFNERNYLNADHIFSFYECSNPNNIDEITTRIEVLAEKLDDTFLFMCNGYTEWSLDYYQSYEFFTNDTELKKYVYDIMHYYPSSESSIRTTKYANEYNDFIKILEALNSDNKIDLVTESPINLNDI